MACMRDIHMTLSMYDGTDYPWTVIKRSKAMKFYKNNFSHL